MLVDDSAVVRGLLARIIDAQADMRVEASAPTGKSALDILRYRAVDVVLLDVEMPEMDGLTALPLILEQHPQVRVIMASSLTQRGADVTLRALALGAADYIAKPSALSGAHGMESISRELVAKVRALAPPPPGFRSAVARTAPAASPAVASPVVGGVIRRAESFERTAPVQVIAIAASTGGPNALAAVLSGLPRDFPLPVLIAQHMPPLFTVSLAERLERESGRSCREARQGEPLESGRTYIAPGDYHMVIAEVDGRPTVQLDQRPPINFCRPAADPLLQSVAEVYGPGVLTLVLTGMGEDGLRGCQAVVARGGQVLVQDQATSVVWGMPRAVAEAGLASAVLPLNEIAPRVSTLCAAAV